MSPLAAILALVTSGAPRLQSADGAGVALAALAVVGLLIEREIVRELRSPRASAVDRRITLVIGPLSMVLAALIAARLASYL